MQHVLVHEKACKRGFETGAGRIEAVNPHERIQIAMTEIARARDREGRNDVEGDDHQGRNWLALTRFKPPGTYRPLYQRSRRFLERRRDHPAPQEGEGVWAYRRLRPAPCWSEYR